MVLGDVFPDFYSPNILVYEFRTSHMIFNQNEHVKINETSVDTEGHFKANLFNVMDALGRLTSKHHETSHTAYINHNNSFNDLRK